MGTTQLESVQEPKYWHLKTVLAEALDSEFTVGEVLPNERDLAARFGVARATLRQALEQLELEGRLQRRRGVGTTVAPPRIGVPVGPTRRQLARRRQRLLAHRRLRRGRRARRGRPPARRRTATTPVHTVRRVRMSHSQPVATELLYVPRASVPELPGLLTPSTHPRAVLRELHRLELEGEDRTVELGSARADDAKQLDRLPGAPVLVVTTRYVSGGRTAAVAVATYRADTCRLTFGDTGAMEITQYDDGSRQAS